MNEFFSSSSYKGGNRVVRHYLLRAFKNKQELIIVEVPAATIDSLGSASFGITIYFL